MKIINEPYDLLERKSFRYLIVFGGAIFALFFLWIFEPFGLYNLHLKGKLLAISLYIGSGTLIMYFHFFPLQEFLLKKLTVISTFLWLLLSFVLVGTSSSIINDYLYNDGYFNFKSFFMFQGIILSINIIPVGTFILIHYNITLRKRLKVANNLNNKLERTQDQQPESKVVTLNSNSKKEKLNITLDMLLYISSIDNYIEVHYLDNGIEYKKLLRCSLSRIEKDNLHLSEVFRCHKSYIINKDKVESISGNAGGYKLELKQIDHLIPVSRKWNKEINHLF